MGVCSSCCPSKDETDMKASFNVDLRQTPSLEVKIEK